MLLGWRDRFLSLAVMRAGWRKFRARRVATVLLNSWCHGMSRSNFAVSVRRQCCALVGRVRARASMHVGSFARKQAGVFRRACAARRRTRECVRALVRAYVRSCVPVLLPARACVRVCVRVRACLPVLLLARAYVRACQRFRARTCLFMCVCVLHDSLFHNMCFACDWTCYMCFACFARVLHDTCFACVCMCSPCYRCFAFA